MKLKHVGFQTYRMVSMLGVLILLTLAIRHTPVAAVSIDDSWRSQTPMPTERSALGAVVIDGRIYAIGGWDGDKYLATVEEYYPITNTWRRRADLLTGRGDLAVIEIDRKIYTLGGYRGYPSTEYLATVEEYNPTTNTWHSVAAMPTPRGDLAAVAVDGRIYALGGLDGDDYLATVEEYDPTTNTWRRRTPMPTERGKLATAVVDGRIYAFGGFNRNDRWLATVEEYDPATNTWRSVADMPTSRGDLAAAVMGGRIYALGGYDGDDYLATVEEYDPATNMWRSRADLPTPPKKDLAAAVVDGRIYALGGYEGGRVYSTVEEYDPPYFDTDGDGLSDDDELGRYRTDPLVPDADMDTDGDGLPNVEEVDKYATDPLNPDSDGDDLPDIFEIGNGLDPLSAADAQEDNDQDGLLNLAEYQQGTNPMAADSDGDELPDGFEVDNGLDPLAAADSREDPDQDALTNFKEYLLHTNPMVADTDEDGLLDGEEVDVYKIDPLAADTDGDTYSDGEEVAVGTDPNNPEDHPITTTSENPTVSQTITTVEIPHSEPSVFQDLLNFPFELTSVQKQTAVVVTAISSFALLGAAVKASSLLPPILGKRSNKDFLKRLIWYLFYPFIWIFSHIVYDPVIRRLKREDITTNKTRQAILQLLDDRGVAYLREIERAVGSGIFGLMWHLQVLEDFGYIRHTRIGKYLVYYLKEYGGLDTPPLELRVIFKNFNARNIIIYIMNHPGTYQSEIARALGLHHTSVKYHLLPMKEKELVESFSDGRLTRYFILEEKKSQLDYLMEKIKPEYT